MLILLSVFTISSCVSVEDIAMDSAADILASGTGEMNIFTMDDDPQLIADALPLALKLYEMILSSRPGRADLQLATGKNFVLYANAFIQTPAGMLPDDDYIEQEKMTSRAKKMYIRGRDYIMESIELSHPGFEAALSSGELDRALGLCSQSSDAEKLYWGASGWVAAYSCDPFDFEMANELYIPAAMLYRALELDEDFSRGAIHDVMIQIYSSLPSSHLLKAETEAPETLGAFIPAYYAEKEAGSSPEERAFFHFSESLRLSGGSNPGTYTSWASAVSVKKQDYIEYRDLLEKALDISAEDHPENELVITIYQEKARWMLEHAEDFFIIDIEDYQ